MKKRFGVILVSLAVFSMSFSVSPAASQSSAAGRWEGSINIQGGQLEITVVLARGGDGAWRGKIDIPSQALEGFALANVGVKAPAVSFEIPGIPGQPVFRGKISAGGQTIIGDFIQRGMTFPFTLERKGNEKPGAPTEPKAAGSQADAAGQYASRRTLDKGTPARGLEGIWEGGLDVSGATVRLILDVSTAADGAFTGNLDSPDQGAMDLPIDTITLKGKSMRFEMQRLGALFEGMLSDNGSEISGQWKQGGASLPLTFKRTDKAPELRRPQEPKRPYAYNEEDVVFENRKAGVKLAGTLTLPRSTGPFPAALLITGSGAQDRNETVAGHRPFLVLSDHLTRRGIAVLRVDDRGVGGSTGSVANATCEDFAGDVLMGIEYLKGRGEIEPRQIGLIGHSEGALVAPIAAVRSTDVAFIILMSGPGLVGEKVLYLQGARIAKTNGASDGAIAANRAVQERMFAILKQGKNNEVSEKRIREGVGEVIAQFPEEQRIAFNNLKATLDRQIKMVLSPWFRFFLTYDPRPTLMKVTCPVLVISGERDLQVPPKENLPVIAEALEAGGDSDYQIVKVPKLNHLFQTCQTGSPSEYVRIEETMAPVAMEVISDWILRHTTKHWGLGPTQ